VSARLSQAPEEPSHKERRPNAPENAGVPQRIAEWDRAAVAGYDLSAAAFIRRDVRHWSTLLLMPQSSSAATFGSRLAAVPLIARGDSGGESAAGLTGRRVARLAGVSRRVLRVRGP
jgi:hypothetical protein